MKKLLLLIILIFLVSCASTKQYVEFTHGKPIETGKGRMYVIKPSFYGSAIKIAVFCDDKLIGNATNGSYLAWDVEKGEHIIGNTQFAHAGATLGSGAGEDLFKINVKEGETYYLKASPRIGGYDFKPLGKKSGESLIKGRKKPKQNYFE
ncbi:DUF2846 domain-containing protein [Epilithonimonas vandammei]|uniref:DUF2846 domain-containing protein n=1 Tax=Epilithonimonas vandammei TaxID=2487072 RepID=UPI0028AD7887|nr:DUF2846 domain-containing protein [Epilithonimonas vandammei]